jgi:hypothetical protein
LCRVGVGCACVWGGGRGIAELQGAQSVMTYYLRLAHSSTWNGLRTTMLALLLILNCNPNP